MLAKEWSISRTAATQNIELGQVRVNGQIITKPSHKVQEGDCLACEFALPPPTELVPVPAHLDILYEDAEIIAINKPQGMVVHPAFHHRGSTLVHYLLHHLGTPFRDLSISRPGIVHRLDRGTSGVILVAKNRKTQEAIAKQFKDRLVEKIYECIVWGHPPNEGTYTQSVGRHFVDPRRMSLKARHSRTALTTFRILHRFEHFAHLEVRPKTGRTHQIRVHLSENGYPILGDPLYQRPGIMRRLKLPISLSKQIEGFQQTFLHARSLTFFHPGQGKLMTLEAKRPPVFEQVLEYLGSFDRVVD